MPRLEHTACSDVPFTDSTTWNDGRNDGDALYGMVKEPSGLWPMYMQAFISAAVVHSAFGQSSAHEAEPTGKSKSGTWPTAK